MRDITEGSVRGGIARMDPFKTPDGDAVVTACPSTDAEVIQATLAGGRLVRAPTVTWHVTPPTHGEQGAWDNLTLAITIRSAWSGLSSHVAGKPLPTLGLIDQLSVANLVVRLASFLDSTLETAMQARGTNGARLRLFARISAISPHISNATELHALRDVRNAISHEVAPPLISWGDVWEHHKQVGAALMELGTITSTPSLAFQLMSSRINLLGESKPAPSRGEIWGERTHEIAIKNADTPYCDIRWEYQYFF